jgi:hypothetical protein
MNASLWSFGVVRRRAALWLALMMCVGVSALVQAQNTPQTINVGETISAILNNETPVTRYAFDARAGQTLALSVMSVDFDPYITVTDALGNQLAWDDDSGGNQDALISLFNVPQDGVYFVDVESVEGRSNLPFGGTYTLEVREVQIATMQYGDTLEGTLTANAPSGIFLFNGTVGDIVTVTVVGEDFSPYVTLNDQSDYPMAYSNYNPGSVATVGPYKLTNNGTFSVRVQDSSSMANNSRFSIRVDLAQIVPLPFDQAQTVTVSEAQPAYYEFSGQAGDIVDISVDSREVDTQLTLLSPDGYQLIQDTDSGDSYNPLLRRVLLSQNGLYIIILGPEVDGGSGTAEITLRFTPIPSLDTQAQTVTLDSINTRAVLRFSGISGERVGLTMRGFNGSQPTITIMQSGSAIVSSSNVGIYDLALSFTTPNTDPVTVQIEDYSSLTMQVEVTLERLSANAPTLAVPPTSAAVTNAPATLSPSVTLGAPNGLLTPSAVGPAPTVTPTGSRTVTPTPP